MHRTRAGGRLGGMKSLPLTVPLLLAFALLLQPGCGPECSTDLTCAGGLVCQDGVCTRWRDLRADGASADAGGLGELGRGEGFDQRLVDRGEQTFDGSLDRGAPGDGGAPEGSGLDGIRREVKTPEPRPERKPDLECRPGETRPCYTGPRGTRGVGACRDGLQGCAGGSWARTCSGQVGPRGETCNKADDDCDGSTDEGGVCGGQPPLPANFSGVTWLHTDVSSWPQTAKLSRVRFSGSQICLDYDKAQVWQGKSHVGAFVNANPWVFVYQSGRWYAATWEWMRHGQTCKARSSVHGSHIKRSPLQSFQPVSGRTYYFMVSGLARDGTRNAKERSNVVGVKWP